MRFLASLPLGPMLLIAVLPYKQWAFYWGAFPLWQAHRAVVLATLLVLVLTLVVRWLSGSWAKAAVVVALPVIGLLLQVADLATMSILLGVAGIAALLDRTRRYENASLALTIMGAVLFAGAFLPIVRSQEQARTVVPTETEAIGSLELLQTPSIIHVVLDGYGGSDVLSQVYGHDTGPFFSELERRGFSVVPDAVTPYSQTLPTMASVMSGARVDLTAGSSAPSTLRRDLGHTIRHGPVPQALEKAGYSFAWSESGYSLLDFERARRVSGSPFWMTGFEAQLFPASALLFGRVHNATLKSALSPGTLDDLPEPFFYYQHLIAPHPPFSLNADGSPRQNDTPYFEDGDHFTQARAERRTAYIDGYRQKIRFVEQALLAQIDSFPEGPKVVIIHGDHGPGAFLHHDDAERSCVAERLSTFAAVYSNVPGFSLDLASTGTSPFSIVNLYRVVLSRLSNAEMAPVEPRSDHLRWTDPRNMTAAPYDEFDPSCGDTTAQETALAN